MADSERAAAFTRLYRSHHAPVLRFIARRVHEDEAIEDLTAEVFRTAWLKDQMSPAWLYVTARNLIANHRRALDSRAKAYRIATAGSGGVADPAVAEAVAEALDRLPERQRDLLVHHYWDELGAAEIAALTGSSVGAVWVRLHRSRQAFKKTYAEVEESARAYR
jgi:RNA polymerase sigma-70 factor (ECF subfamily)